MLWCYRAAPLGPVPIRINTSEKQAVTRSGAKLTTVL